MKASFFVSIGGTDVTGNFSPYVTDISVTDSSGEAADTASISLDDTGGQIALPEIGDPIAIGLGFDGPVVIFEGFVDDVTSTFGRGPGTMLGISAKSADTVKGKTKEPVEKHKDDATLGETFEAWAKDAGISEVKVHSSLASIKRDYWSMNNESFAAWGQRIAQAHGATFKILGGRAVLVPRSAGISANGQPLATIIARKGEDGNLHSGTIKPKLGRPQHAKFRSRWFDIPSGEWKSEEQEASYDTQAEAILTTRYPETESGAGDKAGSAEKETDRERGTGSIEITGDPNAQAEAICIIQGVRPGVDGAYRIDSATHKYSRGGGYNTSLTLKQPKDGAGTDSR